MKLTLLEIALTNINDKIANNPPTFKYFSKKHKIEKEIHELLIEMFPHLEERKEMINKIINNHINYF